MASLKAWSGLKIPRKLPKRVCDSQSRYKSTRQNAAERLAKVHKLETEEVDVKQFDFLPETKIPPCSTSAVGEPNRVQPSHQQSQAFNNAETDSDLDFLHQIGQNRFPTLAKGKWSGLYKGGNTLELSHISQLKLLLAMLCVWSVEQAQTICSAANKIYQKNIKPVESADEYKGKSEFKMCAENHNMIACAKEMKIASFTATIKRAQPSRHVFDDALRSKLHFNDVVAFQPPYPRLQPNSSKFAEGLLNSPMHFIAVKKAFSTSCWSRQNVTEAGLMTGSQTINYLDRSPSRKQFLKSCSSAHNTGLNRESYTRETINKMTSVIKRLPSIAEIKKAENKAKQRCETKHDEKFDTNVYFLGNKSLNGALKEDTTSVLNGVVHSLQQDVNKLSQDKAVLSTEVKKMNDQVESLTQRETELKKEIESLNDQFNTISSENREMFKVKEATFNLVEELCLRRDTLAKEEDLLWEKLERLNKRIAAKYKRANPYGEYNDELFSMESILCSETDTDDEWKSKAGQFLHKKVCPTLKPGDPSEMDLIEPGSAEEECSSNSNRTAVKAMIMEANKHRFRRCEVPICKEKRSKGSASNGIKMKAKSIN